MDWKKAGNYALYIVPLYGIYDQLFRKHKGERSKAGIVFSSVYTTAFIVKLVLLPAYLGKGIATHNWHPFHFDSKDKTEQVEGMSNSNKEDKKEKKCGELEKSIDYDKLFIK
jgi:hypothetical protein